MKVIIAGGRNYKFTEKDIDWLDSNFRVMKISEVVCGMAHGADTEGRKWAERNGIKVTKFPADWAKHGKAAGYIRNREMAKYADALVLFPGGRGSANMELEARTSGLRVWKPAEDAA